MDIFTIKGIVDELNKYASGVIVKKIFHKDNDLYFKLFGEKEKRNLFISISPSSQKIFLTNKKFSFMENPTGFCMLLRKYLQDKRILEFKIPVFYRIVEIDFGENKLLIIFTGKSSDYILCDKDYNIIFSYKKGKINEKFSFPKTDLIYNFEEFKNSNFKLEGLPPFAIKEIKYLSEKFGMAKAWDYYKSLINFKLKLEPSKIDNKIYPYKPAYLDENEVKIEKFSNFNELFDFEPDLKKNVEKFLKDKIKKLKKTLKKVEEEFKEAENYKKYEKFGELIKANLNSKINDKNTLEVWDFFENKSIKIPIDSKISLIDNMKKYFEKSKKLKKAKDKLEKRIVEIKSELQYFEDMLYYVNETDDLSIIKEIALEVGFLKEKQKNINIKSEPFKRVIINGVPVFIGKSAKGNDLILRKFAKPEFVWCHARGVPGAHVLICEKLEKIEQETLEKACKIALKNSKAKNNLKGEVIYTKVKYLKKPKNAPPGLVIVQKENVIYVKLEKL